jgi:hypothetical protein
MQADETLHHLDSCYRQIKSQRRRYILREGVLAKMENQRPGKNPKKLLIEEKSMAIGWR